MLFGMVLPDGTVVVMDAWSIGDYGPHPKDEDLGGTFDILAFNGTQTDGWTTIEFIRNLTTGDQFDRDFPVEGAVNIIWSMSPFDDFTQEHLARGTGTLLVGGFEPPGTGNLDGVVMPGEYEYSVSWNFGKYVLHWRVEDDRVFWAIEAQTEGWVSIGFDPENMMQGADIYFGWVDRGEAHMLDAFATGPTGPHPPDVHLGGTSDIIAFNATETDGLTTLEFVRLLATGDDWDKDIPPWGDLKVIWAMSDEDDFAASHPVNGTATITMGPGGPPGEELDGVIDENEYPFMARVADGDMEIHWKVEGDNITFAIRAKTTGWVSIGFDPENAMLRADMVFGLVKGGSPLAIDAWSTGATGPHPEDTELGGTFDILAYGGTETDGWTTIEFTRKLITPDGFDKSIPRDGKLKVIWAFGVTDDWNSKHSRVGYATLDIATGESESEETSTLWPYHAILMVTGLALMLFGVMMIYRKKSERFASTWFQHHKTMMSIGVVAAGAGLVLGFYMIASTTGVHLRIPHTWIGLLALVFAFANLSLGIAFLKSRKKKVIKRYHRQVGRIAVALMVLTVASGLLVAFGGG